MSKQYIKYIFPGDQAPLFDGDNVAGVTIGVYGPEIFDSAEDSSQNFQLERVLFEESPRNIIKVILPPEIVELTQLFPVEVGRKSE